MKLLVNASNNVVGDWYRVAPPSPSRTRRPTVAELVRGAPKLLHVSVENGQAYVMVEGRQNGEEFTVAVLSADTLMTSIRLPAQFRARVVHADDGATVTVEIACSGRKVGPTRPHTRF